LTFELYYYGFGGVKGMSSIIATERESKSVPSET